MRLCPHGSRYRHTGKDTYRHDSRGRSFVLCAAFAAAPAPAHTARKDHQINGGDRKNLIREFYGQLAQNAADQVRPVPFLEI